MHSVATASQDRRCQSVLSDGDPVHLLGKLRGVLADVNQGSIKGYIFPPFAHGS